MVRAATSTGTAPFRGYETWYRVTGDLAAPMTPLVVVHGGPGFTHDYVLSLSELAATGRPIVHYDQLGCGNSTRLPDQARDFWTVSLFLDELDNLLSALGINDDYHLLGQSWGGMLGAEHALRQPRGLRSLILSNAPASEKVLLNEAHRLRRDLPADVQATLDLHESLDTMDDPAYLAATQAFYDRHICQVLPYPAEVQASFDAVAADSTVYGAMIGPNEMVCTGTLRDWSVIGRLSTIVAPTLLLSGRDDEATPATQQPFADEIPDVRWTIFERSSHMPFVEEPEAYFSVVSDFLARYDDR
jgi:L-proline amide hydrolase